MNKIMVFTLILFIICSTLFAQTDTGKSNTASGTFTRILKNQDYGLSITRLILDLGEGSAINKNDIREDLFIVSLSPDTDKSAVRVKGIAVTDKFGDAVDSDRYVTIDLDFGLDADMSMGSSYIVTLNQDLGIFIKGSQFIQKGRTIRK
ncbi:MAG: hypothetical protein JW927_05320 [Deltaproteobacteria bacterium]|nr:hypothetical protein [Deltaproteobacteria bacterium]